MDFIQTILSSPLPTAIAAVIAASALAGYWFFVIPLLEEVKELRSQNSNMQNRMGDEFDSQKANVQRFMNELASSIQGQQNINELVTSIEDLKQAVDQQAKSLGGNFAQTLSDIRTALSALNQALSNTSEAANRKDEEIRREVERLGRLLEQLTRQVADISDKQSQVAGVLTGMSIARQQSRDL